MQRLALLIGLIAVLPLGELRAEESPVSAEDAVAQAGPETAAETAVETSAESSAGKPTKAEDEVNKATVEEILTRESSKEDYTDLERCISTRRIRSVEVIDEKHVSFQMSRTEFYLVQLKHRCPGLRRGRPVMYEPTANRLCALDGIRGIYDHGIGGQTPGMRCAITGFQSVTKEQIVMLKDALKAERRKPKKS